MPELLRGALDAWRECPSCAPAFEQTFSPADQAAREAELDRFWHTVEGDLKAVPRTRPDRQAVRDRFTAAFVRFAGNALGFTGDHLALLLDGGFSSAGTALARQARRFDPRVSTRDILQAARNAWTACGLQALLGRPMRLTQSIFAYSMLYPYSDNYMDDPEVPRDSKAGFSARFGARLAGEDPPPANGHEAAIWQLVGMIEGEYERAAWPQVWECLRRIHRAQENSLRLLGKERADFPSDLLELCFEKGGASVLADGCLAAGTLSADEARFVYRWGVVLQLADDLQDVVEDCRDGVLTLFTRAAGRETLDALTDRTFHFASAVMRDLAVLPGARSRPLAEVVARSSWSLLVRSAGEAAHLYSTAYIAAIETHSPFRFAFLREKRRQAEQRRGQLARLFEAFLAGGDDEPAFPVLPGSGMI